jgi:hypothetical protein
MFVGGREDIHVTLPSAVRKMFTYLINITSYYFLKKGKACKMKQSLKERSEERRNTSKWKEKYFPRR